jgi:hypothetical protein
MTPTKQTVYLPVEITEEFWKKYDSGEERPEYEIVDANNGERIDEWVNEQKGYFFTPEQLNEYTANVVRQALETAANRAYALVKDHDLYIRECVGTKYSVNIDMSEDSPLQYGCSVITDKESITDTFEETYKKFEV